MASKFDGTMHCTSVVGLARSAGTPRRTQGLPQVWERSLGTELKISEYCRELYALLGSSVTHTIIKIAIHIQICTMIVFNNFMGY